MKREYVTDPNLQRTVNALSVALGLGSRPVQRIVEKHSKRVISVNDKCFRFKSKDPRRGIVQQLFSARDISKHLDSSIEEVVEHINKYKGMKTVTGKFECTLQNDFEFSDAKGKK